MHHPTQRERQTPGTTEDIWAEDVERAEGLARVRALGVQEVGLCSRWGFPGSGKHSATRCLRNDKCCVQGCSLDGGEKASR